MNTGCSSTPLGCENEPAQELPTTEFELASPDLSVASSTVDPTCVPLPRPVARGAVTWSGIPSASFGNTDIKIRLHLSGGGSEPGAQAPLSPSRSESLSAPAPVGQEVPS